MADTPALAPRLGALDSRGRWPWVGAAAGFLCCACAYLLFNQTPMGQLKLLWLDQLFSVRQYMQRMPEPPADLVVIGIDEATLDAVAERVSQPVPKRWIHRYLLERLLVLSRDAGARAVAVDYLLDARVDRVLDADIADHLNDIMEPPAMLGAVVTLREQKLPLEMFSNAVAGNLIMLADEDGKYRRLLPGLLADSGRLPLFAFQACRLFHGELWTPMNWEAGHLVSGRCRAPNEMLVDFIGPAQTLEVLGLQHSALDVLQERVPASAFRDKLVMIGPSLRHEDRFTVSLGSAPGAERRYLEHHLAREGLSVKDWSPDFEWRRSIAMSGLEIQANAVAQILEQRFLRDFSARHPWLNMGVTLLIVVGIGWTFWAPFHGGLGIRRPVHGVAVRATAFLAVGLGALVLSVRLFNEHGIIYVPLELLFAWIAMAATGTMAMAFQVRSANQRIEQVFGPAVGEDTLRYIKANPEYAVSSRQCVATILEADIRGFTPMTVSLGASQTVDLLREYYEYMSEPLVAHGGWVEKYAADSVMAAWNVLHPVPDHAYQAVCAAVQMKLALERFNVTNPFGLPPILNGIGINTGEVVVGNVGSRRRHTQTLIGDTANSAARVESLARDGEVLMSESTYQQVRERVHARLWGVVPIKGKTGTYNIYELLGLVDGPMIPWRQPEEAAVPPP